MELKPVKTHDASAIADGPVNLTIAAFLADAAAGDIAALFNLGVAYSTGSSGAQCDLIEAHKWFNLAASKGKTAAAERREEQQRPASHPLPGAAQPARRIQAPSGDNSARPIHS